MPENSPKNTGAVQPQTPAPASVPPVNTTPVQPQAPASVPATTVKVQIPVPTANAVPTAVPAKPQPTRRPPNPQKLLFGCLGCSGIVLFVFIILALIFVSQTTAGGENPLAVSLGMDSATFVNTIITLVNLIFGMISVALFLLGTVGLFRFFMARKDDKISRKKGLTMAGVSGLVLFVMIFIWVGIYLFMDARRVPEQQRNVEIFTEPQETLGLTAPITISFDATRVPINTGRYEVLSYRWDFGDDTTSTVPITTHTYTNKGENDGRFDVTLEINARDRQTSEEISETYTKVVTIANVEISAVFRVEPLSGPAPLTVNFDASESTAPAGEIVSYEWDFTNNNVFNNASGEQVSHTFTQTGTYKVSLRVTDNTGQFAISSQEIEVTEENLPKAVIETQGSDGNYFVGQQYTFLGEKSASPAGTIEKYEWNFGDGTAKATTRTATHTYKTPGIYEVFLRITDSEGNRGEASRKFNVKTAASAPIAVIKTIPPAEAGSPLKGTVPFQISFDGTASDDPDNDIIDYNWDFQGDGTTDVAGQQVLYTYQEEGIYNATLTVVDAQGHESSAVLVIDVSAQPLNARITATPVEGEVPLTVTFDASGSSYPDGEIVSYEWNFGDGSPKRIDVAKVVYKYTQIGTFTATVTAIASDSTRATSQTTINVRPVTLTACFEATPQGGPAPLTVEFDPLCSTGTVANYNWSFGDGQTTRTRKPSHIFTTPGTYQVTLEVSDNQNVVDTFTQDVIVTGSF